MLLNFLSIFLPRPCRRSRWRAAVPCLLLTGLLLALSGCDLMSGRRAQARMNLADSLMWTDPDSSFALLDGIRPRPRYGLPAARYNLLYAQAHFRTGRKLPNDSLLCAALDYYDQSSDSLSKAWTLYYMGCYYWEENEQTRAAAAFSRAERAGLSTGCNRLMARLYDNWGYMLQGVHPYGDALRLGLKALPYAEADKDSVEMVYIYRNVSRAYSLLDNGERCHAYLDKALDLASQLKRDDLLFILYIRKSQEEMYQKKYEASLQTLQMAQRYMDVGNAAETKDVGLQKMYIYTGLHQGDSARRYLSVLDTSYIVEKVAYYWVQSEVEKGAGDYASALQHQEIYAAAIDSFYRHKGEENLLELQRKYDYSRMQYEKERLAVLARNRGFYALIAVLSLLLVGGGGYYVYRRRERNIREIIHTKEELAIKAMNSLRQKANEMQEQQVVLQEKEQALREALERQRQLEEQSQTSTPVRSETLQQQLCDMQEQQEELRRRVFLTNEVVKKVEKLKGLNSAQKRKGYADLLLSPNERRELYEAVNYSFNGLEVRLREIFPALTDDDIFVCCLVRMGLPNADIALLTESSDEALKKRKYRIKNQKIRIADKTQTLEDFLSSF